jgi:hypothetical protein
MVTASGSEKIRPLSINWWTARWRAAPHAVRLGC